MKAVILGGAGFLGSLIAEEFVKRGYETTIIDGLLPRTGGNKKNLGSIIDRIDFIPVRLEEVKNLHEIIASSDVLISSMAWTSHLEAMQDPEYDIELNLRSHVHLIRELSINTKVIFLGSRSQFGDVPGPILEDSLMFPIDVQGINKVAAESYYRVFSQKKGFHVASFRIPNCFGEHQPVTGKDIGLIGGIIRDILNKKDVIVYGRDRKRNIIYGRDCARIICDFAEKDFYGYNPFNIRGDTFLIQDLCKLIINLVGEGSYIVEDIPTEIKSIDVGNIPMDESRLQTTLGNYNYTSITESLGTTIDYFKKELRL
jgi:UDP-glucose 4-epimerase